MKVIDTYIVKYENGLIRLYLCEGQNWYAEKYNVVGDFNGMYWVSEDYARELIDQSL